MSETRLAWQTFWLAAATIFMISLDTTVVVAAFPAFGAHFAEASAYTLSWTINGYTIVFAALLVPAGRWVDRMGRQRCFLAAVVGFTLASAACAFATAPVWLIAARVLQAVAAAMLSPASLSLILAAFPKEHRSRSAGLWSAVGALAAAMGPLIGSLLIDWFSWRMIFLINVPIGLGVWWFGSRLLGRSDSKEFQSHFDVFGTLLIIAGVGCLAGGLAQAEQSEWTSRNVTWPLAAGITLVMSFIAYAHGRRDAALDLALFDQSNYRWASAATLVLGMAFGMMFLAFYLFFIGVWHYPQSLAGMAATPGPLLATALAIVVSKKQDQWGKSQLLSIGGVLFALSNLWLTFRISPVSAYFGTWLPGQIVGGFAIGLMLPSLAGAATAELQTDSLGVGSAVNNAVRQLGSSLGVALAIALAGSASDKVEPFRAVYLCLASAGLVIALLAQGLTKDIKAKTLP